MPDDSCESKYTLDCVHGTRPPCSCACPMNMDLRGFMSRAARGSVDSAYRVLANELLFPEIITRLCGAACAGACAENLDIAALERACIKYARQKTPPRYSTSKKEKRVAVVGAGLAGLACTLRLAVRGFPVTVFDRRGEIGGSLFETMDRELYLAEFEAQFKYAPYELRTGTSVESLDELADFDAVFVATGSGGVDFGLLPGWDSRSMASPRRGVWLGGELTGASKVSAAAQGRVAGTSIEKYLLMSESMSGVESSFIQTECLFEVKSSGAASPVHDGDFDRQGLQAEAARCRKCDCTACFDSCAFLRYTNMYPPDVEAVTRTIPVRDVALDKKEGSRLAFSCAVCGHCGSVCPRGISLEQMLIGAKRSLREQNAFPPQIHGYYISDMLDANGENYLLSLPEGGGEPEYLFFPGCQAGGSGAEHVKAGFAYLNERWGRAGVWLGCCGIPALWAGDEPLFRAQLEKLRVDWERAGRPRPVLMCPTCMKTFEKYLPELRPVSLYELLELRPRPARPARERRQAAVFDPCASRDFPDMQRAVRRLAETEGYELTELDASGDKALCCGNGGQIYTANRAVAGRMTGDAAGLSPLPYISYCENCRNSFLISGKECRHILDEVFELEPPERPPHIDELRKNRAALRAYFAGGGHAEEDGMRLVISDEVYRKLDSLLISTEELKAVIRSGERTHMRLRLEQGRYIGHLKSGYVTYWAEYRALGGDSYEILNAYCHKMDILEGK